MLWALLAVSAAAVTLSEVILFRVFAPPDATAAFRRRREEPEPPVGTALA
jgi:hypothetical protein